MSLKTVLIGSTGLIGSQFLVCLETEDDLEVNAITRRTISGLDSKDFIKQSDNLHVKSPYVSKEDARTIDIGTQCPV